MGLIGNPLSLFGGGSKTAEPEPEPEAEPADNEAEETEADEDEADGDMSTKAVTEMADPRRHEGEANTVHNRATNPDDQRAI
jgi:hypothetical protein